MTQEEKELLIKDLCERLLYGVKFACNKNIYTAKGLDLIVTDEGDWEYAVTANGIEPTEIEHIKPYLRPMSSMTSDERFEYDELQHFYTHGLDFNVDEVDWLLSHHFDFRGLIPMDLALEAPEGMYN